MSIENGWVETYGNNWKRPGVEDNNSLPLEEVIKHIVSKEAYVLKQKQQKVTRYFCSLSGGILMKDYLDGRQISVNSQQLVTVVNKIEDIDYMANIDYKFYFDETQKLIDKIIPKQKLKLF